MLPVHPRQAFQADLETYQSVINLPVIRASQRLTSLVQVDLVSKLGSAVAPGPCWRVKVGGGATISKPQQILTPAAEGTRQPDTLAKLIWHTASS